MFDTLVESTGQKKGGRTGWFFLATSLIYLVVLTTTAVLTILWFNPGLTDALDVTALLAPPPPPPAAPPPPPAAKQVVVKQVEAPTTFTPPTKPPEKIPPATEVKSRPVQVAVATTGVPGGVPGGQPGGVPGGVPGGAGAGEPPPPPPPPPQPTPTPTPRREIQRVSGGVLQGSAIKKIHPPYPPIAKAAHAQGAVQIQVLIGEDGRVISADVVSGHPLLREAALQAARQWVFRPTELSGVPVKVQGILTFNFTLQ
jgi:protein TonB